MKKTAKKAKPRTHAQIIKHHAKRVIQITPKFVHGMFVGALVGGVVVMAITAINPTSALSIASSRDNTANAVLKGGALTTQEVQQKYSQAGAATIYNYYGISAADVASLNTTAVAGVTKKDGSVIVNGKVVAVNASSTGRQKINGSHAINYGGMTFYETSNQAAFRSDSIAVFVVMKNGVFDFAIMGACGNPVKGTPTTTPPPPAPTKPTPKPTPPTPPTPDKPVSEAPHPQPETPVEIKTASAPVSLPNTGPGALIVIAALAIIGGYVFHITHHHVRTKHRAKKAARHHTHHHA